MNFRTWEAEVTEDIRQDALWKVEAYRLGLFVADIGWHDVTKLMQDRRTLALSDQLYRALGSPAAIRIVNDLASARRRLRRNLAN
jgi:hypothetical protein